MKKLIIFATNLSIILLIPSRALAQSPGAVQDLLTGANTTGIQGPGIDNTFRVAIELFVLLAGLAAVVYLVLGGFKYITSSGDSGKVAAAKQTILYALVGIIFVVLAQVLVSATITKFAK